MPPPSRRSSVSVRYHSERNLITTEDGQSGNTPLGCRPLSSNYSDMRSLQSSAANISRLSASPPLPNISDEQLDTGLLPDDVPQLGWLALAGSETQSLAREGSEQVLPAACGPRLTPSSRSDRRGVLPFDSRGFNETPSSKSQIFHITENVYDSRRRLSDGALLDRGMTAALNQKRSSKASLRHRRHRPSCLELCEDGLQSIPLSLKSRLSLVTGTTNLDSETDASVRCSDRLTNCSRCNRPTVSNEEVFQRASCRFRTQRRSSQPAEADRDNCQMNAVDSCTFSNSQTSVGPATAPTAFRHVEETRDHGEIRWKSEISYTMTSGVPANRSTSAKRSERQQHRPTADSSVSPSSTSISETANHFQMSTFRRIRNSINTTTPSDILSARAATLKRRHTIATKERKASKVLGIIFAVFLLLWTPFFVVNILSVVCGSCLDALGATVMSSLVWLGYSSSLANPIVYTMFSTSFRTVFYRIVTCRVCRRRRGLHSATSFPPSRQVTMGDAVASGRQGGQQAPAEITGLINRVTGAASK